MASIKELKAEKAAKKLYTVKYTEEGKKDRITKFDNLNQARVFAMEKYKEGTFVSLTNKKKVKFALGTSDIVKTRYTEYIIN